MLRLSKLLILPLLIVLCLGLMSGCLPEKSNPQAVTKENTTSESVQESNNLEIKPDNTLPVSDKPVQKVEINNIKHIAASEQNSYVLTNQGELYTWGRNNRGELGIGHTTDTTIPIKVPLKKKIKQIAPGAVVVTLTEDYEIYTWGIIEFGKMEGDPDTYQSTPIKFTLPEKISKIASGKALGLAISETGSLYAWGANNYGQRGDGTRTHSFVPHKIDLPEPVVDVSCTGNHVIALSENGNVYTWGSNFFGELGDGKHVVNKMPFGELIENNVLKPHKVDFKNKVVAIATGRGASYALDEEGVLYSFGANDVGQLGVGDSEVETSSIPLKVAIDKKINMIASGNFHAYALAEDGTLYGWGRNSSNGKISTLGIGTTEKIVHKPKIINILGEIALITAGNGQTWVLTKDNKAYGWGDNSFKQISHELPDIVNIPTQVKLKNY